MHDRTHAYGKDTLKAIFHKLLSGLPTGRRSRYRSRAPEAVRSR
jgi:hypothetical protein